MRYHLVKITVAAAMAAGILLSPKLWLTERYYPQVPVWDGLPTIPSPGGKIIFVAMLLLLGLAALLRPRWPIFAFVALACLWSMWDQTRWQPWFYQYLFMLAALGFAGGTNPERQEAGLNACRLILAATYIYSGLQKFNISFVTETYPWVFNPVLELLSDRLRAWVAGQGWHVGLVECSLGLALLVWPARIVAVPLLIVMHATILYCLSPWGRDWNSVVWPWNIAMMVLGVLLFVNTRQVMPWHIVWPRRFLFARLTLVLFGVMPLLSFFGYWDSYLSAALYSGNTMDADIIISDRLAEKLPPAIRANCVSGNELDLLEWAIDELNVPPYPARRVFRGIAQRLSSSPGDVTLVIKEPPDWRTGRRDTTREKLDGR